MNRGHGGCNEYHWLDRKLGQKVEAWAAKQKTQYDSENLDQIVDQLRYDQQVERQLRGWMRTKTCFRLRGDKTGSWRTVTGTDKEAVKFIEKKYDGRVEFILTTTNIKEAVRL